MSTFLQLTNKLIQECGSTLGTLSTVQNPAAGEAARMVGWIQDAWVEIQQEQPFGWDFLQVMAIATNMNTGAAMSGFTVAQWVRKTFRCWITSQGNPSEQIVNFMTWDDFRNIYQYATQRENYARPVIISVAPNDKALAFGPIPDGATGTATTMTLAGAYSNLVQPGTSVQGATSGASAMVGTLLGPTSFTIWNQVGNFTNGENIQVSGVTQSTLASTGTIADSYTIACECWVAPQQLVNDADVPLMPAQFHNAIVYLAMQKYAGFESAPEVDARAEKMLNPMLNRLYIDQLPVMASGPPLATDPR